MLSILNRIGSIENSAAASLFTFQKCLRVHRELIVLYSVCLISLGIHSILALSFFMFASLIYSNHFFFDLIMFALIENHFREIRNGFIGHMLFVFFFCQMPCVCLCVCGCMSK